jgi:hypothetical protein
MSVINAEAGNCIEAGSLVCLGADGRIYSVGRGGIGCAIHDVRKDEVGSINIYASDMMNIDLHSKSNLKLDIEPKTEKNIKFDIKNNIQIAKDRLNAII